jgi:hypothetical protein
MQIPSLLVLTSDSSTDHITYICSPFILWNNYVWKVLNHFVSSCHHQWKYFWWNIKECKWNIPITKLAHPSLECSVRLYLQFFVGEFMSYLRYLFAHSCVRHILCCVFVLFVYVLCTLWCKFLWIVQFWLPLWYSLTFIRLQSMFVFSHYRLVLWEPRMY